MSSSALEYLLSHPDESTFTPTRLPSLYADLNQQRTSNPEGFSYNSTAWLSALTLLALKRKIPSESLFLLHTNDALLNALSSRQYGRPTGLGGVLDAGVREGKVIRVRDFKSADRSIYEKSWLGGLKVPSVGDVVRWSLRQIGVLGGAGFDDDGRLRDGEVVLVSALEDVAKKILQWYDTRPEKGNLTGRIFSREDFTKELSVTLGIESGKSISAEDVDVLLLHLSRDRNCLSYNATTVKFKATQSSAPEPISNEDTSIANFRKLITDLSRQTEQLEIQISALQTKASTAVKNKNKTSAMAALRSKSTTSKALEQRQATLHQLEDVYAQISQAADQITIVNTLKESAGVLKFLNKKVGEPAGVDEIMDQLREEMGRTAEVGAILQEPLDGADLGVVDAEVDEEFEEMQREDKEKEVQKQAEQSAREDQEHADRTKERLAELQRVGVDPQGKTMEQSPGEPQAEESLQNGRIVPMPATRAAKDGDMDVDQELARSVEKLDGMKITDVFGNKNTGTKGSPDTTSIPQEKQQVENDRLPA